MYDHLTIKELIQELSEIDESKFDENRESYIEYIVKKLENKVEPSVIEEIKLSSKKSRIISLLRLALVKKITDEYNLNTGIEENFDSKTVDQLLSANTHKNQQNKASDEYDKLSDFGDTMSDNDFNEFLKEKSFDEKYKNSLGVEFSMRNDQSNDKTDEIQKSYSDTVVSNGEKSAMELNEKSSFIIAKNNVVPNHKPDQIKDTNDNSSSGNNSLKQATTIIASLRDRLIQTIAKKDALVYKLQLLEKELELKESLVELKLKKAYELMEKLAIKELELEQKEQELNKRKLYFEGSIQGINKQQEAMALKEISVLKEKITHLMQKLVEKEHEINELKAKNFKLETELRFKDQYLKKFLSEIEHRERDLIKKENELKIMMNEARIKREKLESYLQTKEDLLRQKEKELEDKEKFLNSELEKLGIYVETKGKRKITVEQVPMKQYIQYYKLQSKFNQELKALVDALKAI